MKDITYTYLNADGSHYCTVTRTADKQFFAEPRGLKGPHPLYRVERLAGLPPDTRIFIAEGEKDVHSLEALGLIAVTNKGGSNAVEQTDWSPLERFQTIVKFTDHDEAGEKHTKAVARALLALPGSRTVIEVSFPDLPEKSDVSDWLEQHAGALEWNGAPDIEVNRKALFAYIRDHKRILTLKDLQADNANEEEDSPIRSLLRAIPPSEHYPVDALPDSLRNVVRDVAGVVMVPEALAAQSFLAAAALAVQAHGNVEIDGRTYPVSLYCLSICESGDRKTAVDQIVLQPHRDWQQERFNVYDSDYSRFKIESRAYKNACTKAAGKAATYKDNLKAMENLGDEPLPPLVPTIFIGNMTAEALHQQLNAALPYLGVFSDESGAIIGGYSMSADHMLKTLSDFSKLWDGKGELRIRSSTGMTNTFGKRVSMHFMAQPDVARILLGKRIARTQGFLARMLPCWPETLRGSRTYQRFNLQNYASLQAYQSRVMHILNTEPKYSDARKLCLDIRTIPLSSEAYERWVKFHDEIEQQNGPDGPLNVIAGWASKAAEHAARIAGVLALFDDLNCPEISKECMNAGIQLALYYLGEMYRIHAQGEQEEETLKAEDLLQFMRERQESVSNTFTSEFLLQYGPNSIRNAVTLQETLELLKAMGAVKHIPGRGKKWGLL